jgi:branched-chain amino acid transport system permease protein
MTSPEEIAPAARHRAPRRAALLALLLVGLLLLPVFAGDFAVYYLVLVGIDLILVVSLDLLVGYTGLLSLAHAGFMGIGAYTSAILATRYGTPFPLALGSAFVAAAAGGALVAYPSVRLRGHSFVVMTFVAGLILATLFNDLDGITRGPMGIPGIPAPTLSIPGEFSITLADNVSYYYLVLSGLLLLMGVKWRLVHSRFGRALQAIRSNEELARSVGVRTSRYKIGVFAISAGFAGLAGSLYAHRLSFIGPDTFTCVESFNLFVMNFVGGAGTMVGPVLGTLFLSYFKELARDFSPVLGELSFGVLLLLTIGFMPAGMVGAWRSRRGRWRR